MVLVSYIPYSHISILQAKFSHREGYEASRGGLETMPLDQDIEGGHGEREPGVNIRPTPVHNPLAMAHDGQHGEHCLDEHTVFPLAALTQCEISRVPLADGKTAGRWLPVVRGGRQGGRAPSVEKAV